MQLQEVAQHLALLSPLHIVGVAILIPVAYLAYWGIYNAYFHPLSKFPGPLLARSSYLWYARNWISGRWPHALSDIHKKYGHVVRIAPDELAFSSAQSWRDIYGHSVKGKKYFRKTDWYAGVGDLPNSISTEPDPRIHGAMRRVLANAFSNSVLKTQADVITRFLDMFVAQIKVHDQGEGIRVDEWFNWLTFDIIGDLTFHESFGAVENARPHFWISWIINGNFIRSLYPLFQKIPISRIFMRWIVPNMEDIREQRRQHIAYTKAKALKRASRNDVTTKDFFSFLLEKEDADKSDMFLTAQAHTLIIAGSETTAVTLTAMLAYLLRYPDKLRILNEEVRRAFTSKDQIDADGTLPLQYLFAVIEETLRILPPVPFGLPRTCPGATIDGHVVPAGAIVSVSPYTASHDPQYWHDPEGWHPERWLEPEHPLHNPVFDMDNKEASRPFSTGPRVCLGVNLAYIELRMTLARLLWEFDIELLSKPIDWNTEVKFFQFWKKGETRVKFTSRF
ncbi:Cytochrome P450 monooxygenase boa3 [Clarireedia jacksonii]